MLTFLADENFDNRILRGLQLWVPEVDLVRAQDVGLRTKSDEGCSRMGSATFTHHSDA